MIIYVTYECDVCVHIGMHSGPWMPTSELAPVPNNRATKNEKLYDIRLKGNLLRFNRLHEIDSTIVICPITVCMKLKGTNP